MAVNTNVYGTSEQWSNAFFQQAEIVDKNKLAYFGENAKTLSQGVANNKLSYSEPIDKSLSYCGLGTESAMSHVVYCGLHDNAFQAYDSTDRQVTNFAFFEKQTSTNYTTQGNIWLNELDRIEWSENMDTEWNYTRDLIPYTVVNPHNMILVIFLSVSNGDGVYYDMTLEYFIRTFSQYNWTRISRVKLTPYFGNNADNVPWSASAGYNPTPQGHSIDLGILDEYVVSAKNKRFYMYENPTFEWIPFGFVGANGIGSLTDTNLVYMCYIPESAKNRIKYDNTHREFYIEYYEGMVEDILKTVACFGLYFSTTTDDLGNLTNQNTYIGLLDEDGVGRGRYLQGADTVNAPQAQSGFKDMHDIPYDYKAVDNTHYQNDTQFYDATLANGFTRFWVLDAAGVSAVLNQMYSIMSEADPDEPIERYSQKVFLTNNPIDCIISLKKFPLDNVPSLSGAYFVNFGAKATNILAYPLAKACGVYSFTFSSVSDTSLYPHFDNSFLDYEPYTKCELVIPFCGSVDIPCCYLYDYGGIEVKLVIDFISGACTAYVLANGITITSVSGNCAIDLPVSGIQSATLDSQIFSAAQAKKQNFTKTRAGLVASALTATAGAVTGNPLMIVAGAAGVLATALSGNETRKSLDYELQHLQTPYKEVSSASGQIAQTYDMRCKMIVTRPKLLTGFTESAYAETVGYSCLYTGEVENFHGLTVGSIELAGVPCTAEEKAYIESMFASGVHLPEVYP